MSKSNTFETQLLTAIFETSSLSTIGSIALGANLYVSLHTADPGEAGSAVTSEATYTGYARVAMGRDGATWTVTGNEVVNDDVIVFDLCTGGTNTITHFGIVNTSSGAGTLLYKGALDASLAVSNGIEARFDAGELAIQED